MLSSKRWGSHFKHSRKEKKHNQNKTKQKFHPSKLLSEKEQHGSRCSWWALSRGGPHCLCCWFGTKFVYFMQISVQQKLIRVWLVMHSRREAFLSVRADEGMWAWLLHRTSVSLKPLGFWDSTLSRVSPQNLCLFLSLCHIDHWSDHMSLRVPH